MYIKFDATARDTIFFPGSLVRLREIDRGDDYYINRESEDALCPAHVVKASLI